MSENRVLDIYLDDAGMHELDILVTKTKLAPLIKNVILGLRRVANVPIVIRKKTSFPSTFFNCARTALLVELSELKVVARQMRSLITTPSFSWNSKATHDLLHERDFAIFTNYPPGGCQMLEHGKDYTPDDEVIGKFIEYVKLFPNLQSIRSNEETKHWMLLVQNKDGSETVREVIKDREGSVVRTQKPAFCGCYGREDRGQRACKSISSMSRFLLGDLARVKKSLMIGIDLVDIPLWTSLREFRLNFLNIDSLICRAVTAEHHDLSVFLLRCRNLTHLRLSTTEGQDRYTAAAEPITYVLKRLKDHGWKAKLESLELSCVDPIEPRLVDFLETHEKTLKHFYIKNATPQPRGATKAARFRLWHTLQRMTGLSGTIRGYEFARMRIHGPGNGGPFQSRIFPETVFNARKMAMMLSRIIKNVRDE